MPWTTTDYPDSMKNLTSTVRKKAIEIANSLVEDGYEEGRAIPIAIEQAKETAESPEVTYHVSPTDDGKWKVEKKGAKKPTAVHETKKEAIDHADEIILKKNAEEVIHKKDGSVQKSKKSNQQHNNS